ncbi:MAG: SDR family NAD(P)-dependent oxidoreductase [Prevotella sp.]|nr:SDR family NAD(P)-dependent oxidoreductase [Bacteroides sp.]MCM1366479.1 SDR family NAD(P)-dependent oxidoreductase [Prevotella sp.]MCM1436818.1 SDR family NAD(P)-dependent oxidoreductase [Prevotella sp.]
MKEENIQSTIKNPNGYKKIVIMGASSGIGYGVAEAFAKRGVPVGLAARHIKPLEELQARYPDSIVYEKIDITHHTAAEHLQSLIDKLGGMDIYFHVSGIGSSNPTLNPEEEARILNTNVVGFARMVSAAYDYFRRNDIAGQIAAITSVAGTNGMGNLTAYSSSKRFDSTYLTALCQRAFHEKAAISVTDIRPGWVRTPLVDSDKKYPMEMTVEEVVPQIIEAIVKRRRVAVIDYRWRVLVALWQLIPDRIWTRLDIDAGSL